MLGVRLNSFNDSGISEPEQDANSALTELDKGLRSSRVGEQCEAIVRFPRLFEKYPFPILINSSFLKLADVFRMGNNFLRLWVLRVCQQSEKHLDKIFNVDEFVKRVFNVFHSNDPVARALTLKTFGAVASIIPEKQNVHHAIRRALDSHDSVEVEAAIYAASQLAAQSKTFAVSMCNKISEMIRGQATPASLKLRLLPCLRHMHHSAEAAGPVRELLTGLLPRLPAAPFVRLILHTLTDLAASTLIDIPDQVSLLLEQLGAARASIRATAVSGLRRLAGTGRANLWPQEASTTLAIRALTLSLSDPNTLANCLGVLEILMKEPLMIQCNMHPESAVRKLARQSLYSQDLLVASKAAHILTVMSVHCYQESLPVHDIEELMISLESLIIITGQIDVEGDENKANLQQLKLALKCVVQICECSATQCNRLVSLLGSELESCEIGQRQENIATALGAIGSRRPDHILVALPSILRTLNKLQSSIVENENSHCLDSIVLLCTIVFQCVSQHTWPQPMLEIVNASILNTNLWIQFRVARAAMRYGQHSVAADILNGVAGRAGSELAHHWLGALQLLAGAEACLQGATPQTLQKNVRNANTLYHQAMAALKAGWSGGQCSPFQWEYVRLRGEMLGAMGKVLAVCRALCAQPPPAIALSQAQTSRDDFLRCGHITQQLRRAGAELRTLAEGYCKLYQQSFDADPSTLEHLQILQQVCSLMAQSLERISTTSLQDQAIPEFIYSQDLSNYCLESQILISTCRKVNEISAKMMETQEVKPIITHKQVEGIWLECAVVCRTPLPLPRFLFQPLQHTALRLSISPQPRGPQEHHVVPHNHHLTVKIEGVIQTGPKSSLFRTPTAVQITLTAHMSKSVDYKGEPIAPFLTLTERVKPAHDFFACKLLVNLTGANNAANNNANAAGGNNSAATNTSGPTLVLLVIEAALLDQTGALWKTGPRHTLSVRVFEDSSAKNAQSQAARRF